MNGGSWSYAARMMAPVLVMVAPLTVLGYDKLSTVRERASTTRELAAFTDLEQARGAVILPAASERTVLIGLAVIDDLGISRDVAADVAGLDLEQQFAATSLALDAGLENLVTRHGSTVLEEGDTLAERLAAVRGQLDDQRRFTAANRGLVPAVQIALRLARLDARIRVPRRQAWCRSRKGRRRRGPDRRPAGRAQRRAGGGGRTERGGDRPRRRTDP